MTPALDGLDPDEAFRRLDNALYLDTGQSTEQVAEDARRFFRFDFLTNGGESFDHTKSFLVNLGDSVRLIFRDEADRLHSGDIPARGVHGRHQRVSRLDCRRGCEDRCMTGSRTTCAAVAGISTPSGCRRMC